MSFDFSKIITVTDTGGELHMRQVVVDPHVMYPAILGRARELMGMVDKEFGGVAGFIEAGVTKQMRFAIEYGVSDAELPVISSFYRVPAEALDWALQPVWEMSEADLRPLERVVTEAESQLAQRAWVLDCALAMFMRLLKAYSQKQKWGYNTEIKRDLRYRLAWISEEEATEK